MRSRAAIITLFWSITVCNLAYAVITPPTADFSGAGFTALTPAADSIVKGGVLKSQVAARSLLTQLVSTIHSSDTNCDISKSTFIINIVSFKSPSAGALDGFSSLGAVQNSNWYIFDS